MLFSARRADHARQRLRAVVRSFRSKPSREVEGDVESTDCALAERLETFKRLGCNISRSTERKARLFHRAMDALV